MIDTDIGVYCRGKAPTTSLGSNQLVQLPPVKMPDKVTHIANTAKWLQLSACCCCCWCFYYSNSWAWRSKKEMEMEMEMETW